MSISINQSVHLYPATLSASPVYVMAVLMEKQDLGDEEDDKKQEKKKKEYEAVNAAKALWTRSRSEVKDDEYKEFYKHVSHDFEDPLQWSHNKVEGKLEYTSLLYVPGRAPFDLWNRDAARGLKLYVQRVFIMDDAEQFLPLYLRFMKGVVDSNDISLNVSREILQKDPVVDSMRSGYRCGPRSSAESTAVPSASFAVRNRSVDVPSAEGTCSG